MFAGDYAPQGWAPCDGRMLPINGNEALYSLLDTLYGGDGVTSFGLPDLRGRLPIGMGQGPGLSNRPLGQQTGTEQATLTVAQTPTHTHAFAAGGVATGNSPQGQVPAAVTGFNLYASAATADAFLAPGTVGQAVGGAQPHNNVMPSMPTSFIICLLGSYPNIAS